MRNVLIATLLPTTLCACTSEKTSPPRRPDGSWWLGGDDGGAFVDIKEDKNVNDKMYNGTIYFESDQTIWYQGPLQLKGNIKFSIHDRDQYIAWDGERLLLKQPSYLEAMNPASPL